MKKFRIAYAAMLVVACMTFLNASAQFLPSNYDEPFRGQYHFSQQSGWMNDINGLWFEDGVYHLAYQSYANSLDAGPRSWGHATSTDMLHWTQQANILDPGVNVPGDCWSGSTVIDVNNTSGFKTGSNAPLVTIYTATTKGTCLAYSNDQGTTWVEYAGNPVAIGGVTPDTRDPHVFWHEATSKWVCVFFENGFTFYTSPDIKTWTKVSNFAWGYECPDMFELAVDGGATKKWVLQQADGQYWVGTFDGTDFVPDEGGPYRMVYNGSIGGGFYASQTYFMQSMPDQRIVQMAWMSGMGPGSTAPWTHNSTFPCELKLQTFPEGVRVARTPISEISSLYTNTQTWDGYTLHAGQNLFSSQLSNCFDLEAVFDLTDVTATALTFKFANKVITYDIKNMNLFGETLKPINNQVKIRFLVDWGELEVFGNDGQYSYAENFKFEPENSLISMTANGDIKLVSARYSPVDRTWASVATSNTYIDDAAPETTYGGEWHPVSNEGGYYKGTCSWSNVADAYVEYNFTGTQVSWHALKNNDLGMADVYIDDVLMAENIDCYSTIRITQLMYSVSDLPAGDHKIKVVVNGTKQDASSGIALVHDFFSVYGAPSSPTVEDDASQNTSYDGVWSPVEGEDGFYANTYHQSTSADTYFQTTFTGSQVFWYGLKNEDLGMAAVYIDEVLMADDIDCYSTTRSLGMLFSKNDLTEGSHTIKVVVKGMKNAASSGVGIVHDYFDFPVVAATIIDDYDGSNIYNNEWIAIPNEAGYHNNTLHVGLFNADTNTGAEVELTFTGTQISWHGLRNNDLGLVTVYIDGEIALDDVDCYGTNRRVEVIFSQSDLTYGIHTIRVVQKGTKNPASLGTALVHDYFSFTVPNGAALALSGDLTFGSVAENTIETRILTIRNTNLTAIGVSSIELPDGYTADWTRGEIGVNEEQQVIISFQPTEVKNYLGAITVNTNAGNESIQTSGSGELASGVHETMDMQLKLFPNPVQNQLTVCAKDMSTIEIAGVSGTIVSIQQVSGSSITLDMSNYPKGVFMLKVTNTKGAFVVRKVIKN